MILSLLKIVAKIETDTNVMQSPHILMRPHLMRSPWLKELDNRKNNHKWCTICRPLCVNSDEMAVSMSLEEKQNTNGTAYQ